MTDTDERVAANLRTWDERVAIHAGDKSGIYQFDAFFAGDNSITPIDDAELGDIAGLRIAHLQCHFGLDTIRLARQGASTVGLDFSPSAIKQARVFAEKTGADAQFVQSDLYRALDVLEAGSFDMVYVSWGAIYWLPNIKGWANVVADVLKPGGRLYLAEGHPQLVQMEEHADGFLYHAYAPGSAQRFDEATTYAGDGRELENKTTYEWLHSLGEVLDALIAAGMRITGVREHDTIPWPAVPCMIATGDGMFRLPDDVPGPPCSFSLDAIKTG